MADGLDEGENVGADECGDLDGTFVGRFVGDKDGTAVGSLVGDREGQSGTVHVVQELQL